MTVSIAGDQVTLKRASSSASGTAGAAGQISCTDDYTKLVAAKAQPAPSLPWYAATLITWPDKAKATTATLSHELTGDPDLCIAQSSDQQTSVVMYFNPDIKAKIEKQQTDTARQQQAGQADAALKGAAQAAVAGRGRTASSPRRRRWSRALTGQGLYVKTADTKAAATETGTIYVIAADTTDKQLVLALKAADGKVTTVTQKTTGDPKVSTGG